MPHAESADEDLDQHGSQSDDKAPLSINSVDILSVNQLMESVYLFSVIIYLYVTLG